MIAYSSSLTFLGVAALAALVGTLVTIRRNLTSTDELDDSWPPMRQVDEKRNSFAQEDIDGLKDGSSWITSDAGSCHGGSVSAFSFSTHQTHARKSSNSSSNLHHGSVLPKSPFWSSSETPGRASPVPPVPPLPAPYRPVSPTSANMCEDPDPFRRTVGNDPRVRNGSQASWLTEPSIAPSTATAWSFPATRAASRPGTPGMFPQSTVDLHSELLRPPVSSRPQTPAISSAQVLGGYGFSDVSLTEKQAGLAAVPEGDLDTNVPRVMTWFITVLLPCVSYVYALYCQYVLISSAGFQSPVFCLDPSHWYCFHCRFNFDDPRHHSPRSVFGPERFLPLVSPRPLRTFRIDRPTHARARSHFLPYHFSSLVS